MARKKNLSRATKTAQVTSIVNGDLFFEDVRQCSMANREMFEDCISHEKAIRVVSLDSTWYQSEWLGNEIVKADIDVEVTLRVELRSGIRHWYAYRRVAGKLYKRYVGQEDRLTARRLIEVCRAMPTNKIAIRKD